MTTRGEKINMLITGFLLGVSFLSIVIAIIDPAEIQHKKDKQEAVDHEFAKWVATTNGNVVFEWNKQ